MKPKIVGYSHTYAIGLANFEKIWIELELEAGDDPRQALYSAKKTVESFHYESNKAAEKVEKIIENESDAKTPEEKMINQINEITEINVLQSFELLAKRYPAIQVAYNNRLKQLQHE